MDEKAATLEKMRLLASGRHYGSSADSGCWVMVGRDFRELETWAIIPSSDSLTYVWGTGACRIEFEGGELKMSPGDLMWIDAGFAHRGENLPGSNFVTLFFPPYDTIAEADSRKAIGAAMQAAPRELANMLMGLAVLLLEGKSTQKVEGPFIDAALIWVTTALAPRMGAASDDPMQRAEALLRNHAQWGIDISEVSSAVGMSAQEFSRRFADRYRITPEIYRKQLRLALATQSLARGNRVVDAAHDAGFADSAHLSRTFKAQYGLAPSNWARRLLG